MSTGEIPVNLLLLQETRVYQNDQYIYVTAAQAALLQKSEPQPLIWEFNLALAEHKKMKGMSTDPG